MKSNVKPQRSEISYTPVRVAARTLAVTASLAALGYLAAAQEIELRRVGCWPPLRGDPSAAAVSGHYAYLLLNSSLATFDLSQPTQPIPLGQIEEPLGGGLRVVGNCAFVNWMKWNPDGKSGDGGVHILDLSDPARPRRLGSYDAGDLVCGIDVVGDLACLACYNGLQVVDVSNPAAPVQLGVHLAPECWASAVQVARPYAYLVGMDGFLNILDVSVPAHPTLVGRYSAGSGLRSLHVVGPRAYLPCWDSGMQVVDISVPSSPTLIRHYAGDYNGNRTASSVRVEGNRLYVTGVHYDFSVQREWAHLDIYDLTDPDNLVPLGTLNGSPKSWGSPQLLGQFAVLAAGDTGLDVVDVADPSSPGLAARFVTFTGYRAVAIGSNYACAVDGGSWEQPGQQLMVFDVRNPANLAPLGQVTIEDTGVDNVAVDALGDYAYVTSAWCCRGNPRGRLSVVRLSDPAHPAVVGQCELPAFPLGIQVVGPYAYVCGTADEGSDAGLLIVDVRQPTAPFIAGGYGIGQGEGYYDVRLVGSYAYLATYARSAADTGGLRVVHISNPAAPVLVGSYSPFTSRGTSWSVEVGGSIAMLDCSDLGVHVLDVSDPSQPALRSVLPPVSWSGARDIRLSQGRAYLCHSQSGDSGWRAVLQVWNVATPAAPALISTYASPWQGDQLDSPKMRIAGDRVYLVTGQLSVLEVVSNLRLDPPLLSANMLTLSWKGGPGIKLQKTLSLSNPNWQDVAGTVGQSLVALPPGDAAAFFRLIQP